MQTHTCIHEQTRVHVRARTHTHLYAHAQLCTQESTPLTHTNTHNTTTLLHLAFKSAVFLISAFWGAKGWGAGMYAII